MRFWLLVLVAAPSTSDADWFVGCASCAVHESQSLDERLMPVPDPRASRPRRANVKVKFALRDGDVIEEDASGHVVAVRHATTPVTWTRFKPGAVSPPNELVVVGEIDDQK